MSAPPKDTLAPKLREKSNKLKQLDLFYREPTGDEGVKQDRPEDSVPDLPENKEVCLSVCLYVCRRIMFLTSLKIKKYGCLYVCLFVCL